MGITLIKGEKRDLTKSNPGLRKLIIGLGWDTRQYQGEYTFDIDTSAFLITKEGKVSGEADFVFYNNLHHPSGAVVHLGDHIVGMEDGDGEQIKVQLDTIPNTIERMIFTVTIHEAVERVQNFGQVADVYIHIIDETAGRELVRYNLEDVFSKETGIVVGELYRCQEEWQFAALGDGYEGGLMTLCNAFGIGIN